MYNKNRKYSVLPIIINIVISALSLVGAALYLRLVGGDVLNVGLVAAAICVVLQILFSLGYRFFSINTRIGMGEAMTPALGNMTLDLMIRLDLPVLILDENRRIVWYNKSFTARAGVKSVFYGKRFEEYCPTSLEEILSSDQNDGVTVAAFDGYYTVKAYPTRVDESNFTITVWQDTTELFEARRLLEEEDTQVAYIVIDNLDEILRYVRDKYRSASGDVADILKSWVDSVDGIIKEYERDKFVFLFAAKHLDEFVESKFDILDRVREIRVGDGNLPITVSMGISGMGSSLAEKEMNAHAALDTALQRGGDQVVVRRSGENEIYGGRVQTSQKRTKVRARVFADQLASMIAASSNVLVMAHTHPDFDAIGASVGIARLCFFCGVPVNIITDPDSSDLAKCADRLSGLSEYKKKGVFVDSCEGQELLESDTLLIIVDVNNPTQFQAPYVAENAGKIVVIDHHRKTGEANYNPAVAYIEPAASSASELVAEVLEHCLPGTELPREEADLMLAGIMLDTKQFMRNTGSRTFGAALYLRSEGANPTLAQELFRTELSDLMREAAFESNVIIYRSGLAIAQGGSDGGSKDRIAAAKAADKLLSVDGIEASFVVCSMDQVIHVSARSAGKINVQLILEKLGGGGHFDSAATQFRNITVKEALERLKGAIDAYLDETHSNSN